MMYLYPSGGVLPSGFAGYFLSPGSYGVPVGVQNGTSWAGDNQAFTKGIDRDRFLSWLEKMRPYQKRCLFIAVPDCVGNARKTLALFAEWIDLLSGWPLAFVAQDGQENETLPDGIVAVFLGGTTRWKMSQAATNVIGQAQRIGLHVHVGRVNYKRRYNYFSGLPGGEEFTCDGTRIKYQRDRAILEWQKYMGQRQLSMFVPECSDPG